MCISEPISVKQTDKKYPVLYVGLSNILESDSVVLSKLLIRRKPMECFSGTTKSVADAFFKAREFERFAKIFHRQNHTRCFGTKNVSGKSFSGWTAGTVQQLRGAEHEIIRYCV